MDIPVEYDNALFAVVISRGRCYPGLTPCSLDILDGNSRGWHMYDNTYVMDPRVCAYLRGIDGVTYTNLNKSFYASYNMPFDERFIKYFTSVGIDTTSEFYVSNIANDAELDEYFVTTGYYIERGIPPLGTD